MTGQGLPERGWHTAPREYNCGCCMNTVGRLDLIGVLDSKELGAVSGKPWNLRLGFGWCGWHIWCETARREGLKCMAEVLGSKVKSCLSNCFYIFLSHVKFCLHRHMVCSYQARVEFAFLIYIVKCVWAQFMSVDKMETGRITLKSTISWGSVREAAAKESTALQFPTD